MLEKEIDDVSQKNDGNSLRLSQGLGQPQITSSSDIVWSSQLLS